MDLKNKPVLVLGASGFIGSHLTKALLKSNYRVRAFSRRFDIAQKKELEKLGTLEVIEGSVFDEQALQQALTGISLVINLVTFSIPSTSPYSLQSELNTTLQSLNLLLSLMAKCQVKKLIFPSSGGTIYGNSEFRLVSERDRTAPLSSYGMGKLLCEEMIGFHHRTLGLDYLILRISNPYGAGRIRRVSQGVIDVFLEKVKAGQPLSIWASADTVRDYIFIDDLTDVTLRLIDLDISESVTLNIGSGIGTSLQDILLMINKVTGLETKHSYETRNVPGVPYNVLDIQRLQDLTGWKPTYDLESGIQEAWNRKQESI
ncbi:MAG: NAD-dependent epimerase/dehydratase family protein [Acidobacteria bacterium]|nr:NAD-dependent epimerase/dehydratase family protein [Acidobacteriota bacterium]